MLQKWILLLKRLDERATEKEAMTSTIQAMDSHMKCEVCGEVGHSENKCPETHEDVAYINNGFQQGNNNGWNNQSRPQGGNSNFNSNYNLNQPSLKDLVLGQAKINENITKKLTFNDKMLENINFLVIFSLILAWPKTRSFKEGRFELKFELKFELPPYGRD